MKLTPLTLLLLLTLSVPAQAWQQGFLETNCNPQVPLFSLTPVWVDGTAMRHNGQPTGEINTPNLYSNMWTLGARGFFNCLLPNETSVEVQTQNDSARFSVSINNHTIIHHLSAKPDYHLSANNKLYHARVVSFNSNATSWTLTMALTEKGTSVLKQALWLEITRDIDDTPEPITYQSLIQYYLQ